MMVAVVACGLVMTASDAQAGCRGCGCGCAAGRVVRATVKPVRGVLRAVLPPYGVWAGRCCK